MSEIRIPILTLLGDKNVFHDKVVRNWPESLLDHEVMDFLSPQTFRDFFPVFLSTLSDNEEQLTPYIKDWIKKGYFHPIQQEGYFDPITKTSSRLGSLELLLNYIYLTGTLDEDRQEVIDALLEHGVMNSFDNEGDTKKPSRLEAMHKITRFIPSQRYGSWLNQSKSGICVFFDTDSQTVNLITRKGAVFQNQALSIQFNAVSGFIFMVDGYDQKFVIGPNENNVEKIIKDLQDIPEIEKESDLIPLFAMIATAIEIYKENAPEGKGHLFDASEKSLNEIIESALPEHWANNYRMDNAKTNLKQGMRVPGYNI